MGRNALYFEDYILAIQYFNNVIQVKPYQAEPYLYRSIAKFYLDDYLGAEQDASLCIDRNPFLITAYHVRGLSRLSLQQYDGAIADFNAGLKMQPEHRPFLGGLASVYAQQGDVHRADSCYTRLIRLFPSDESAYLGRAQLRIAQGDSVQALADLDHVLKLDKGSAVAYGLRSMIYMDQQRYADADADLSHAILLDPQQSAYYINRGLARYYQDNIRGALSDYEEALTLDPSNTIPRYNRGLLRAQVGDRNRAIEDFSAVLDLDPDNTFAAYNRALLRDETGDYRGAIADYTRVYEAHKNFFPALYARSEDYKKLGQSRAADDDFKAAFLLEQQVRTEHEQRQRERAQLVAAGVANPDSVLTARHNDETTLDEEDDDEARIRRESDRNIRKFNRGLASNLPQENTRYSSSIRGRVQDRNFTVDLQPLFVLTYYDNPDQVHQNIYFEKSLSDFNRAGLLSRRLKVVSNEPMLTEAQVQAHFASIDDYARLLSFAPDHVVYYFGRSLDYMLVQDYQNAINDLNQVLMRRDDFILAYFNRAVLRLRWLEVQQRQQNYTPTVSETDELRSVLLAAPEVNSGSTALKHGGVGSPSAERVEAQRKMDNDLIMHDLDKVIELSPTFVYAYYNRAWVSSNLGHLEAAVADLDRAIELYPNFAEAYYNRGLIRLRQGLTQAGIADLSKAGELGLTEAYSVLRRAN
jgi:tetratricopeptide (TPR) repeat protein